MIIAVDPGLATGVAFWLSDERPPETKTLEYNDALTLLWQVGTWHQTTKVVIEDYVITQATLRKSRQAWSMRLIGAAQAACLIGGHEFIVQTASQAKSLISDDVLRRLGWRQPGRDHENDALRHLAYYLITQRILDGAVLR